LWDANLKYSKIDIKQGKTLIYCNYCNHDVTTKSERSRVIVPPKPTVSQNLVDYIYVMRMISLNGRRFRDSFSVHCLVVGKPKRRVTNLQISFESSSSETSSGLILFSISHALRKKGIQFLPNYFRFRRQSIYIHHCKQIPLLNPGYLVDDQSSNSRLISAKISTSIHAREIKSNSLESA